MRLELFYDVISPWSFLCFEVLGRYRRAWDIDLVLRPAFLGGVLAATGNAPPASVPARGAYLVHDLDRTSRQFAVPLRFPSRFPINTIAAMRLLTLIAEEHPRVHEDAARLLWQRYWQDDVDVADLDVLRAVCGELGVGVDLIEQSALDDNKARLREATNEAVARGAFGFPAMFVDDGAGSDALFFGSDRLSQLAYVHGLPWVGPVPPDDF
ncbi:MAG TPA: DsbA family protein [Myxococcota bacterium]